MNIFKKLSLINKICKIIKEVKKHFDKNTVTKEIKEKFENFMNATKDLGNIVPECKIEIEEIIEIIKKYIKSKK